MSKKLLRVALLISGTGSTACRVITDAIAGALPIEVVCVISSRSNTGGMENVCRAGMPVSKIHLIRTKDFGGPNEAFGEAIIDVFNGYRVERFAQLGWLPTTPANVLRLYRGINQHPAPLDPGHPDFGGQYMQGSVAVDAFRRFVHYTGIDPVIESTVHAVEPERDKGRLMGIRTMRFSLDATTKQIQAALLPREHENVVHVLDALGRAHLADEPIAFLHHRMSGDEDSRLIRPEHLPMLERAKQEAIKEAT